MNAATLIAVPQAKELEPLLTAFSDAAGRRSKRVTLGKLEADLFEEFALLFAVGGHGKTQLAVQTQHLIEQETQFEALVCAGAAGSLGGGPTLGDVVVGTSTIEHDYKLRFVSRPLPCYQADPELVDQFQTAASRVDRGSGCTSVQSRAAMRTSSPQTELSKSGRQPGLCASLGRAPAPLEWRASMDFSFWRCEQSRTPPTMRLPPISR